MHCPVCKEPMIIVEHESIELDYCTKCLGVWFDAGELELMLEAMDFDTGKFNMGHILVLPQKRIEETVRKCPLCRKKMKKVGIGHDPEVVIDVCPSEEGLWFDGGEVGQVIKHLLDKHAADIAAEERVINFLGEAFKASA